MLQSRKRLCRSLEAENAARQRQLSANDKRRWIRVTAPEAQIG
jgi:hypothetical protein